MALGRRKRDILQVSVSTPPPSSSLQACVHTGAQKDRGHHYVEQLIEKSRHDANEYGLVLSRVPGTRLPLDPFDSILPATACLYCQNEIFRVGYLRAVYTCNSLIVAFLSLGTT